MFTVTELARALGVTARTLRFYEDKGLIAPLRLGTTRCYSARDRARMTIILRAKRLGFTLRDIGHYLDLYDADHTGAEQLRGLVVALDKRIGQLEQQHEALAQTLLELQEMRDQAVARLGIRKAS